MGINFNEVRREQLKRIMETMDNVKMILEAGMALGDAHRTSDKGTPYAIVPGANGAVVKDLSEFLEKPLRVKQKVQFDEASSFVRYVNAFKEESRTAVFAKVSEHGAAFAAVLDYHSLTEEGKDEPGWCQHVAEYTCPVTVEWKRWYEKNTHLMDQTMFAEFIEQNQLEIVKPPGAEMLEIATTLKAKSNVDFVSGVRLSNGQQQLTYQEQTSAQAGVNGNLTVPEEFELGLPVFQGGPRYSVRAFLRYRISNKKLHFHYVLFNPHKVIEHAAKAVLTEVAEGTKIEPFMGAARF